MCSKCNQKFSRVVTKTDKDGNQYESDEVYCDQFDVSRIPRRTSQQHRKAGERWLAADNDKAADKIVSDTGYRYIQSNVFTMNSTYI